MYKSKVIGNAMLFKTFFKGYLLYVFSNPFCQGSSGLTYILETVGTQKEIGDIYCHT